MTTPQNSPADSEPNNTPEGLRDEELLFTISELIEEHTPGKPYARNTLLRIKDLLERSGIK